jgi:anti-anti-sigma regulatory factor
MREVEDQLSVVTGIRQGCRVVVVSGDLDADTAARLDDALDSLPEGLPVLIDLGGVSVLTSVGVVVLLAERMFGRPALFCPDGSLAGRILEVVQAQRLVPIYRDLDAALASLGATV